ncbi:MAG TPA: Uma2 family endonuclease [Terracidiphilus sp.]|jgi:Uma2 family endonuclease|nr:Uma2 family endonuclease [Terracidiphilus sp.]
MATLPVPDYDEPQVTVEEYLRTSYRPDCDYVDGRIEERNVGEYDHGLLQTLLGYLFVSHRTEWGIRVVTDVRTQVSRRRFRVPDLCVLRADAPKEQIISHPPLIAIEILSPEDRLSRFQERIEDYLGFGVEHIWIIDPERRAACTASATGLHPVRTGELTVPETPIRVALSELFAEMDKG